MKEAFFSILGILKFFFIAVPVFLIVYFSLEIYFEIKNLIQWITKANTEC
jgi:hypothetical protein